MSDSEERKDESELSALLAAHRNGEIKVFKDEVAEKLDELADVCEYWKKNRDKGRNPNGIRAALLYLVSEIEMMRSMEEAIKASCDS